MLVLCLTYSLSSYVLFRELNRRLEADVNALLISKAEGIQDSIESYWEAEKSDILQGGPRDMTLTKRNNANFERIVRRWLEEKAQDPLLADIGVEVFDAGGKLMASSGKSAVALPEAPKLLAGTRPGERHLEDLPIETSPDQSSKYRVFSSPQMENGQVAYSVQVLSSLEPLNASLRHFKVIVFLLFPFIFILSGLVGAFLARVTMNPVSRMLETIRRISAENLKLRVAVPDSRDELQALAETFNGMLDRLEKAFTSQEQFIEDMAHELKTPLAAIKGELEVTLKRLRSAEDYASVLNSSLEEVNRIIGISENLLTLARYDADRLMLEKAPVDIGALVQETADQLTAPARQKGITLGVTVAEPLTVSGDRAKLRQLLLNLLDNALKHTPTQGTVSVAVGRDQGRARLEISDTGEGIPDDELPHIFDRFYRGKASAGKAGFGLGLTIAKSVAEAHLGKIDVASRPSRGTTFTVFLPLARD